MKKETHKDLSAEVEAIVRRLDEILSSHYEIELPENITQNIVIKSRIESHITEILHKLGIQSKLSGYRYLKTTIKLFSKGEFNKMSKFSSEIYPKVAKVHCRTPMQVERAMRMAIETGYEQGNFEFWEKLFGYSISLNKCKPTNSEFISVVVEYLML